MSFALLTDSSCGIPPGGLDSGGAGNVPIYQVDLMVETHGGRTTTSQPSHAALMKALAEASANGSRPVIAPVLSSRVSGTAEALASAAAEGDFPCEVIDTRTIGGALALAVLAGSRQTEPASAAAVIREVAAKSMTAIVVADLKPLVAGGRLRAPTAMLSSALGIVPVIDMRAGELKLADAVRGKARARSKMLARLVAAVQRADGAAAIDLVSHEKEATDFCDLVDQACQEAGLSVRSHLKLPLPPALEAHTGVQYWGVAMAPVLAADIHGSPPST